MGPFLSRSDFVSHVFNKYSMQIKSSNCFSFSYFTLVPFRLTPQIQSLMWPFRLHGPVRETMIHTLQTLTASRWWSHLFKRQIVIVYLRKTKFVKIDGKFKLNSAQFFYSRDVLMAALSIFIKEPTLDWLELVYSF